jgi:hypothetical protein
VTLTHDHDTSGPDLDPAPTSSVPLPVPSPRRKIRRRGIGRRGIGRREIRRREIRRREIRRGPGHRARPLLTPPLRWRVLVATLGAILLTVCSGMALGVVTWSPSGLGLRFRSEPLGPPVVTGLDGVWPGGPARSVPLAVQNTQPSAFEMSTVVADLTGLPAGCPASAWRVAAPELLPTVPARSEVTVPLPVSLTADAPETCQGMTLRFPVRIDGLRHPLPRTGAADADAGSGDGSSSAAPGVEASGAPGDGAASLLPHSLTATATVAAARLGSPGGTVSVQGTQVEIVPTRPGGGPVPARYDVDLLGPDDRRTVVCAGTTGACVDHDVPPATARRYLVTAWVGSAWHQVSRPLAAWTPPPAPTLAFAADRSAGSTLLVTARGAASAYDVELSADGTPFHRARVAAGSPLTQRVLTPDFDPGRHRLVATARFHSWRAPSATLTVTVRGDGVPEPGPSEEPLPLSSDPPSPSPGPPTVPLPSSSTLSDPARTTTPPSSTVRTGPVTRPAPAPPQQPIDETPPAATDGPAGHGDDVVVPPVPPVLPVLPVLPAPGAGRAGGGPSHPAVAKAGMS